MEIIEKLKEFEKERKKDLEEAIKLHAEFLKQYPFRERPEEIEKLTLEKIYNPGMSDYFLRWIEFKLKALGHISVGSASYVTILCYWHGFCTKRFRHRKGYYLVKETGWHLCML